MSSTVSIAFVHSNQGGVTPAMALSLGVTAANLGQRVVSIVGVGSPHQVYSRNEAIAIVRGQEIQPDWFLWWDTDMSVEATVLRDLIATAEAYNAKVATPFGVMQKPWPKEGDGWRPIPHAYYRTKNEERVEFEVFATLQDETEPFWCDSTGLGFTLIHMSVFDKFTADEMPFHDRHKGLGHDIRFFHLAGEPVLYVPDLKTSHWKMVPLDYQMYKGANGIE